MLSYLSHTALVPVGLTVLGPLAGSPYEDLVPTYSCPGLAEMALQLDQALSVLGVHLMHVFQ